MDTGCIPARLVALHDAIVGKIGAQPCFGPSLTVHGSGRVTVRLYVDPSVMEGPITLTGPTAASVLDDADDHIAAMPEPEAAKLQKWHGKLAKVIDEGHAMALPAEVMDPLREGLQAMHGLMLAAPAQENQSPLCRDCGQPFGLPGDTLARCHSCREAHARFVQA